MLPNTSAIAVALTNCENVLGYAFCIFQQHIGDNILTDIKTLYIDDLCVDETLRGQHIGKQLYEFVVDFAKKSGCYNVTLNVWACNESAKKFYEKCGFRYSHRIPNFFTDHYDHPICEGGVLLRDMVYLQKPLAPR